MAPIVLPTGSIASVAASAAPTPARARKRRATGLLRPDGTIRLMAPVNGNVFNAPAVSPYHPAPFAA